MKNIIILLILGFPFYSLTAQISLKSSLKQSRHEVICAAYSNDGKYIVTGGLESRVFVWDANEQKVLKELKGVRRFPLSVCFSIDGKYVIAGGKDRRVNIWDFESGNLITSLRGHSDDVTSVKVSPDNKYIASASADRTIRIWDLATKELVHTLKGHRNRINSIDFSPLGNRLISGSSDETIREWDVINGTSVKSFKAHFGWVRAVAYDPNGNFIASGGDDNRIKIWNAHNYELQNSILAHSGWVEALDFSPDGKYLLSGGHDNYLIMIEVNTGKIAFNSRKQSYYVLSVAFNPNGQEFVSSTLYSDQVMVWNTSELGIDTEIAERTQQMMLKPKAKPEVYWITENQTQSNNITKRVNYKIKSEYTGGKLVLYMNGQRYASKDNFEFADDEWLEDESIVYLNEGENTLRIEYFYPGGLASSDELHVSYKPEPALAEVPEPAKVAPEPKEAIPETVKAAEPATTTAEQPKPMVKDDKLWSELIDLPFSNPVNPHRFALIIGNEDYSSYQIGLQTEANVDYAIRDANAFREYAIRVFGVPPDNILFLTNARAIEMHNEIDKIKNIIRALNGKAEIIFYYAGHGFPDEKTREPHIMPVDVTGTNLRFAIKINDFYKELSAYPSERITVFMDACFSGGARNVGLVAARGVRVRPRDQNLHGNLVVFTASSENQSAHPYREKQHGIFTYFLLNKLKETKGEITYKELSDYINQTVGVRSAIINNTEQTPQTNFSPVVENKWQNWTIR